MKRKTYLFPLMAVTALSLSLAACDDKKDETAAVDSTAVETPATTAETPAADAAAVAPVAVTVAADGATAYATAEGASTGAVFVTLTAAGDADKLVGATTDVATSVEIHESAVDAASGAATMRKVDSVELQPGQPVSFKPDGYHLMLIGLTAPLTAGQTFNVTLDFDKAADVVVPVTVTAPGAADAGHDHQDVVSPEADDATATETPADATSTTEEAPATTEAPSEPAAEEGTQTPAQ